MHQTMQKNKCESRRGGGGGAGRAGQGGVPHRFTVQAAAHYHTRAWKMLIYRKECFILLLLHELIRYASTMQKTSANPGGGGGAGQGPVE